MNWFISIMLILILLEAVLGAVCNGPCGLW